MSDRRQAELYEQERYEQERYEQEARLLSNDPAYITWLLTELGTRT